MEHWKRLIDRFWRGQTTKAERRALLAQLEQKKSEIKRQHWHSFQKHDSNKDGEHLDPARKRQLLQHIHEHILADQLSTKPEKNRLSIVRWVAAAAIILSLSVAILLRQQYTTHTPSAIPAAHTVVTLRNTSDKDITYRLPDSSTVSLAPRSLVSYRTDFNQGHRDILLTGKAQFDVTKNPHLAFRVEAHGYHVTALGTVFIVDAIHHDALQIRLLTGKIAVRPASTPARPEEEHLLSPGDELFIDLTTRQASHTSGAAHDPPEHGQLPEKNVQASTGQQLTVLHFHDTPIVTVITQLEQIYRKKIVYSQSMLKQPTYTGRLSIHDIEAYDGLSDILSDVFKQDDVHCQIQDDQIIITTTN
ncbi:FecR family protein [Sphingobacterium allocomposti]|uniref:FecR family protein n=1 Tax=Sphingobacterium allocomposti TaxID=415956 RepID=A0A5S5DAA5_9SPHI|nr:FecR family protein [Sphingobacterium composti Yoo et al. 2007 non Ten et al. 2007]TYP92308.1 FecR family protein [Sphingobacterium composti Yoo et al. 2007 non Ten et al. 2007]